jgi:hypothetical protein
MSQQSKPQSSARSAAKPLRAPQAPPVAAGDRPDLRERVLDAAIACAPPGCRRDVAARIASRSARQPALLHYYFGDKEQLRQRWSRNGDAGVLDRCASR